MKKRILTLLAVCVLLSAAVVGAQASGAYVVDNGELLTADEEAKLCDLLAQVGNVHGIDIVVLTTDSLDGKSAMTYADDFYDYNGYGDDGVLLLVSMSEREWWVSTAGKCIPAIDSYSIERSILTDLSVGHYYDAFTAFAECCDRLMMAAGSDSFPEKDDYNSDYDPGDDYDYDYTEEKPSLIQGLGICLVIGIVAGGIVVLIMMSQLKSVRSQPGASSYVKPGSLRLSVSRDLFLYQNTTRRPKPKDNGSSGGRSSGGVHRSSSGRSHGGGGGRF